MTATLTSIYKSKYDGRYEIELNVNGYRFLSTAVHTKGSIMNTFNISQEEFNNLLEQNKIR